MPTHDPLKSLYALRDHLAAHDKPIAFLFGAGTSCSVKVIPTEPVDGPQAAEPLIPAVHELTVKCAEAVAGLGKVFGKAWKAMEDECAAANQDPNVENVLSRVRMKLDAIGGADKLVGLGEGELKKMEDTIKATIGGLANPADEILPPKMPHQDLVKWIARFPREQPVEIFTTNYDILIERALEADQCLFFDGFVGSVRPFFCMANDWPPPWTRVWKIHGSVNWKSDTREGRRCIIRVAPNSSGEMILPSHRKYDEARKQPYVALLDRLDYCVRREDAIVVTVGFSFSDEHINNVILEALDRSRRSQVFALTFDDCPDDHSLVRTAIRQPKLSVFGPKTAIIGGQQGMWRLVEPVDNKTAAFMDIAFDSDAVPDADAPAVTGRMMLGDFDRFCKFLATMEG
jgi:hypothetical protein